MAKATCYLQVQPEFFRYLGEQKVREARIVRMTQRPPEGNQRGGTVLVKITVDIPDGAFLPLRPEAVVVIPEGMALTKPIEVEAEDANDLD